MANVKGDGGASTSTLFSRSVDPIKKIPSVSFDAVTEGNTPVTVEEWLEAAFYPFIPATITFSDPGLQEDGLLANNVTLGGQIKTWDETVFSNFINGEDCRCFSSWCHKHNSWFWTRSR